MVNPKKGSHEPCLSFMLCCTSFLWMTNQAFSKVGWGVWGAGLWVKKPF